MARKASTPGFSLGDAIAAGKSSSGEVARVRNASGGEFDELLMKLWNEGSEEEGALKHTFLIPEAEYQRVVNRARAAAKRLKMGLHASPRTEPDSDGMMALEIRPVERRAYNRQEENGGEQAVEE